MDLERPDGSSLLLGSSPSALYLSGVAFIGHRAGTLLVERQDAGKVHDRIPQMNAIGQKLSPNARQNDANGRHMTTSQWVTCWASRLSFIRWVCCRSLRSARWKKVLSVVSLSVSLPPLLALLSSIDSHRYACPIRLHVFDHRGGVLRRFGPYWRVELSVRREAPALDRERPLEAPPAAAGLGVGARPQGEEGKRNLSCWARG
jgi:hypothetical protein